MHFCPHDVLQTEFVGGCVTSHDTSNRFSVGQCDPRVAKLSRLFDQLIGMGSSFQK